MRAAPGFLLLGLSAAGMGIAHHLALEHVELYETGVAEGLFCSAEKGWSCGQVLSDPSAWFLGLPVAAWGLLFYVLIFALVIASCVFRGGEGAAFLLAGALLSTLAVVVDLYLAAVMVFRIGTLCPWCLSSYGVNLGLAVTFWIVARRAGEGPAWRHVLPSLRPSTDSQYYASVLKLGIGAVTLAIGFASLRSVLVPLQEVWLKGAEQTRAFLDLVDHGEPDLDMSLFDGQPTTGPEDALVHVLLAGDFQCEYCRSMERTLDELRERYPEQVRVSFLNVPVSSRCNPRVPTDLHEQACWLAEVGECAAEQGRFWEYKSLLLHRFHPARISREEVLSALPSIGIDRERVEALLVTGEPARLVSGDLEISERATIVSTPSLVINGFSKRGGFYPEVLVTIVKHLLDRSEEGA